MARTVNELAQKVMELLGLAEAEETVSAEDFALVNRAYEDRYSELFFRELAYWELDAIDNKAFPMLARIMVGEVASAFGKPEPTEFTEGGQPVAMSVKGLMDLKRLVARERSGNPTPAVYF